MLARKKDAYMLERTVYFGGHPLCGHPIPVEGNPPIIIYSDGAYKLWMIESPIMNVVMRQEVEPIPLTLQFRLDEMVSRHEGTDRFIALLFATKARPATQPEIQNWLHGHRKVKSLDNTTER
jgi:hypothetical protein